MSTIRDVARVAGVSISTVSHVLNDTRFVEPTTRERVVAAITATRYRQDALARALRRSRTDTIGLVLSDVGEPAFAAMIHGIEQAAARRGLGLLLASSGEAADRETRAVETLLHRRVDGLILARVVESHPDLMTQLLGEKSPTVLLDRLFPEVPLDQVGVDNASATEMLTDHLLTQGHRHIAVLAGDLRVPTLAEREEGFRRATDRRADVRSISLSGSDLEVLRAESRQLLERGEVTAVIALSTPLASMVLDVLLELEMRTPHDIAFATFDGFDVHPMFEPSITTVRQPAFDIGATAVDLLSSRIDGDPSPPHIERLEATLELRASTEASRAVL